MASHWYIMFVFGLVLFHVVTARNIPQAETKSVTVNTEVISRAPKLSQGFDENSISFGGIGGNVGGIGGLGGFGGNGNGVGGLGGLGGLGLGGNGNGVGGLGGLGGLGLGGGLGGIGGIDGNNS